MSNPWTEVYKDIREPFLQEKMAKKDYDGDGKIETGAQEYKGSIDNKIKEKMGKDNKMKKESMHSSNPAQQAAIAMAKKKRQEDMMVAKKKKMEEEKKELPTTKMYRKAGNLSRDALSKGLDSKEGSKAQDRSSKIVSTISTAKEKERFSKMKTPAAQLRNEDAEVEQLEETPKGDAGKDRATKVKDRSARSYGGSDTFGKKYHSGARKVIHDMKRGVKKMKGSTDRPDSKYSGYIDDRKGKSHFHNDGQGLAGTKKHGKSDYDEPSRKKMSKENVEPVIEEMEPFGLFMDMFVEQQLEEEVMDDILEIIYEKCWKGYEKKGMKTMFGKRYPNCVKEEEVEDIDESSMSAGSSGGHYSDGGDGVFRSKQQVANMFNKNIPTKKQTGGKVNKMTRKSINTSAKDFGIQGPSTTKESLENAYQNYMKGLQSKVYKK